MLSSGMYEIDREKDAIVFAVSKKRGMSIDEGIHF